MPADALLLTVGRLDVARALGRLDEGLRLKEQALARDPRSALVLVQIAISYWHQRKYDDTLVWAQRALDVDPRHLLAGEFIAGVYLKLADVDRFAAESVQRAVVFGIPDGDLAELKRVTAQMQHVNATAGVAGVWRFMADQITNERLEFDALLEMTVRRAVLYGGAGRLDEAFECLDQAIEFRDPALVHLAVAPQWDALRGDTRFGERLKALGLPLAA